MWNCHICNYIFTIKRITLGRIGPKITFKLRQFTFKVTTKLQKSVATGLSMPRALKERIDTDRGDIPRSRFILRILEESYRNKQDSTAITTNHPLTAKSSAVRNSNKPSLNKNIMALQLVGKPSDNANNRVSSTSKEGSQEG